jgi:hypothetical protein
LAALRYLFFHKTHGMKSAKNPRKQIFKFQFESRISMGSHKPPGFLFFHKKTGRTETIKKKALGGKGKNKNDI